MDAKMRLTSTASSDRQSSGSVDKTPSKCKGDQPSLPQFSCVDGIWTANTSIVLEKANLVLNEGNGEVKINGSLTFNGLAQVVFSDVKNVLNVTECIIVQKKPAILNFNFITTSPIKDYAPLYTRANFTSTPVCGNGLAELEHIASNGGNCRILRFIPSFFRSNTAITYDILINKKNCTIIYITIGVVAGVLAISTIVAIISICLMRKNSSAYSPLSNYADEDTPIQRRHGLH